MTELVRAEWTKFRTVNGWIIGTVVAGVVMVLLGLLTAAGSRSTYNTGPDTPEVVGHPYVPIGPDGEAVTDSFYFAHQTLYGDGSITARVDSFGLTEGQNEPSVRLQPWAKGGLIIKADTKQGSAYAAIMVTPGHGVRMQYNFTGDIAGPAGAVSASAPRWLRLVRAGDTVIGAASTDGSTWTTVGTARLAGLASAVQGGLFATAPVTAKVQQHFGGGGKVTGGPTLVTAAFDDVERHGTWAATSWEGTPVGSADPQLAGLLGFRQDGSALTVTGAGDIVPDVTGSGTAVERVLIGAFGTLTVVAVLAVLFMTMEYRRGLVRTTLAASPRRVRVLAAKSLVIGTVTFLVALVSAAVTVPVSVRWLRANGNFIYPVPWLTEVRLVVGTAAVLALTAVFALALGSVVRRSVGAVTAVVVLAVLPYILSTAGVLPVGPSQWLLRVTPAAAFAIQQSLAVPPQATGTFTPAFGFFPLSPWAGFSVLCAYTAVAFALAAFLLRRRDV